MDIPRGQFLSIPARRALPAPRAPRSEQSFPDEKGHWEAPPDEIVGVDETPHWAVAHWRLLRRHKALIFAIALAGTLLAVLFTLPQKLTYRATTSLDIERASDAAPDVKDDASAGSYVQPDLLTQINYIRSRSLLKRVIEKLTSEGRVEAQYQPTRLFNWLQVVGLKPGKTVSREAALAEAAASLRVSPVGSTRVVEITCESTDPRLAADFANATANEFIEDNVETRSKPTERTNEWLTTQLNELKRKVDISRDQLQSYLKSTGFVATGETDNVAEEKLRQLQAELSKASAERVAWQSKYESAKSSPPETLPEVLDDNSLREYQRKLTDLRRQVAELTASLTPAHYKVQRVQAEITELEASLKKERAYVVERIQNEFEAARRREKLLTSAFDAQTKLVSEQANKAIQYNSLKRDFDMNRQLYEAMQQRLKEAGLASATRSSNIRIVDPAEQPSYPFRPNLLLNASGGFAFGLFAGVILILVRHSTDSSIQQPGEAPNYLSLPELGVIPSAKAGPLNRTHLEDPKALTLFHGRANRYLPEQLELITWQQTTSPIADAFRRTLASILFSDRNGPPPRVIVLASASPVEGKTTVAANLAIALAEINARVLLIDADLRKPRLHHIFGLRENRGLSDLLYQKASVEHTRLEDMVFKTDIPNLCVLPGGETAVLSSGLFYSPRMAELLRRFRREFDMIIIDSPAMIDSSDSRVLARQADSAILVIRAGRTSKESAAAAHRRFKQDSTPVLGTILTDWNAQQQPAFL